jgi:hypothetical protein
MDLRSALVGREAERARLSQAIESARQGRGGLLLLSGEAGIGKTRLAREVATASSALVLRGAASSSAVAPYGPLVAVLRSRPEGLEGCGALRGHLALLLPELGEGAASSDRATIFEAVRCAFAMIASEGAAIVVLDDLQWSDGATLELLAAVGPTLEEIPMLVIAAYRSDGLPRDHAVRWLRHELRRGGGLDELVLAPLDRAETAAARGAAGGLPVAVTGTGAARSDGGSAFLRRGAGSTQVLILPQPETCPDHRDVGRGQELVAV